MEKNEAQVSGFAVAKINLLNKFFSKKEFFQLMCADMIIKTLCGIFFKNKWMSRYLSFGDFTVPKKCYSQ